MKLALAGALLLAFAAPGPARAQDANAADLFGEATIVHWCRPVYPPALVQEKREGIVVVRFIVDDHGKVLSARVTKSFDHRADPSALAAVRQWQLSPALAAGKPVASCLNVQVFFRLANLREKRLPLSPSLPEIPHEPSTSDPEPLSNAVPDYPAGLPLPPQGKVRIDLDLDATGKPIAMRIRTTDRALGEAAAKAARSWTFSPAMQGDLAVPSTYHGLIDFSESALPPQPFIIRAP